MDLNIEFNFCCAHRLPHYDGACARVHGHHYRLLITITGPVDPRSGMILDFEVIKRIVDERAMSLVDHRDLNELLENPTAESLVVFLWDKLKVELPGLARLTLWETPEYSVVYRGQ